MMNGLEEYNNIYQNKIENLISNNKILETFYYYISGSTTLSTCYSYLSYVSKFLNYTNKPVEQLDIEDFLVYMAQFNNTMLNKKQYSASYRIDIYQSLKKFGKFLVATKRLKDNPMDYIDRPKYKESQNTITKRENGYLTEEEVRIYLENVSLVADKKWKWRDMSIIMILLNTGIRASALYKLDVSNINFDDNSIIVTDKEQKVKRKTLYVQTISCIQRWLDNREEILAGKDISALFISNRMTRISQHALANIVKKYAFDINGKNITPHKLRATYGTYMYNKTHDIYFVQKCLDHSSPQTSELYVRGQNDQSEKKSEELITQLLENN